VTILDTPDGRCGAWPEHGGCVLPKGHNRGQADVPEAHRFPQHITIRMPVVDGQPVWTGDDEPHPEHRTCPQCVKPIEYGWTAEWLAPPDDVAARKRPDRVVVTHAGTLHADCYSERLRQADLRLAWATVARDMARSPSTHSAAELRAALTVLARYVEADYLRGQSRG
jgi:hypothetical protein